MWIAIIVIAFLHFAHLRIFGTIFEILYNLFFCVYFSHVCKAPKCKLAVWELFTKVSKNFLNTIRVFTIDWAERDGMPYITYLNLLCHAHCLHLIIIHMISILNCFHILVAKESRLEITLAHILHNSHLYGLFRLIYIKN